MIWYPNTISNPRTVVVHSHYTSITNWTMMSSRGFDSFTFKAVSIPNEWSIHVIELIINVAFDFLLFPIFFLFNGILFILRRYLSLNLFFCYFSVYCLLCFTFISWYNIGWNCFYNVLLALRLYIFRNYQIIVPVMLIIQQVNCLFPINWWLKKARGNIPRVRDQSLH